jgi:histidyl-tRNA synthetase
VKLWTVATCYRYNRAQRGRYREFTQFDAEAIGTDDPAVDAELIALQASWYASLGLEGLELELNTIGDADDRPPYLAELRAYLDEHLDDLHPDVRRQRDVNPLRAFDTKDSRSLEVMAAAPRISDHVGPAAAGHFADVRAFLDARGLPYRHEPTLVRGLDYYTRTTWEFKWPPLGAQSTIGGGGRYDGLAESLGGPRTPGVGFGAGVERLLLALEAQGLAPTGGTRVDAFFAVFEPAARPRLHALMDETRRAGLHCDADFAGRGVKGQLKHADRLGAAVTVLCGPEEWAAGTAAVKRMTTGEQVDVPLSELLHHLTTATG